MRMMVVTTHIMTAIPTNKSDYAMARDERHGRGLIRHVRERMSDPKTLFAGTGKVGPLRM
jgi:hypothetical protein